MAEGFPWACPRCRGRLVTGRDAWRCAECATTYRALRGIADLRTADDEYLPNRDDWAIALRLNNEFDRVNFRGLLDRYFALAGDVPVDLKRRQVTHILTAPGRARRWLDALDLPGKTGPVLDLGCGTGSFLAAVGRSVEGICGVDIAMRWLLVARKRLDEEGLQELPLACACAEDLPIGSNTFAAVIAGDVIEHVRDQAATLAEAHRVLRPGGRLFLASPNRYSVAPEPHVQVWGVGFLPRRWMGRYVRAVKGIEFRAVRTMGFREWRALLRKSPFEGGRITVPALPAGDLETFVPLKRMIARAYNAAVSTGPGQWLARAVGPLFHVVCAKTSGDGAPTSIPAIRRRSRPSGARA